MKNQHYFTFLFGTLSFMIVAQTNEITEWQNKHPDVLFIDQNDLTNDFQQNIESFDKKIIIYNGSVSSDDIQLYESNLPSKKNYTAAQKLELMEIRSWRANNPNVKIITKHYFDQLSESKKSIYRQSNTLVLSGNSITLNDIKNYEATK